MNLAPVPAAAKGFVPTCAVGSYLHGLVLPATFINTDTSLLHFFLLLHP